MGGGFATDAQLLHNFTMFSMSLSIPGQYVLLRIRAFILLIPGCPVWKSSKIFFVKTEVMTTRSPYINMPLHVENILFVLTFWFINSFLDWLMNFCLKFYLL